MRFKRCFVVSSLVVAAWLLVGCADSDDPAKFADTAKNGQDPHARFKAVNRITDQALLADVAKNAQDATVRILAVERVTDSAVLADVAVNDLEIGVCIRAIGRLAAKGEQALIAEVAKTTDRPGVWRWAMVTPALTDPALFADIAKNDSFTPKGIFALDRLHDLDAQALYADVAQNAMDPRIRQVAVEWIGNPRRHYEAVFADIAKTEDDESALRVALDQVRDSALLADVATNAKAPYARQSAGHKLAGLVSPEK